MTPKAIDDSLKNLGTGVYQPSSRASWSLADYMRVFSGYIDLMLIHSPLSGKKNRLEAWKAFVAAKNQGKVHNMGVSN